MPYGMLRDLSMCSSAQASTSASAGRPMASLRAGSLQGVPRASGLGLRRAKMSSPSLSSSNGKTSGRSGRLEISARATAVAPPPPVFAEFTDFDELIETSDMPVLVDFYAPWCGPCQLMSPVVAGLSNKLQETLKVVKIDIDEYPAVASQYQISALPSLVLFKNGKMLDKVTGYLREEQLRRRIAYFLTENRINIGSSLAY